ncbi:TetR family transcriptional regulator [Devosia sp. Root685]|uniref:TetR/AcrR family transcriptional regulator n=1 Tax=Devosia sp. Root685 TaxID=1736587 RepID=UPI0006F84FD5|nr:TetR/AcrR family transcriptional regulator [Devosia sp. Root685]KRA99524.1 TetR family transcriptional regulator [Devosia sp. Root685]
MTDLSNTAEEILRHTRPLILSGGYDGFSYADISSIVGIRKASIHHHFPTKAQLVRVLVERYRREALDGLGHLDKAIADPAEKLRAYTGYWQSCIASGSEPFCVCALLASQMPALPEEVAAEVRAHFRALAAWLTNVFRDGLEQGSLRMVHEPEIEAEVFVATVHGAMLSSRAHGNAAVFEMIVGPLVERFIK